MKVRRLTLCALAALASLFLTLTIPVTLTSAQSSQTAETETGYVISLRGNTLTLSNIPMGSPQGNRGGDGAGPRIMLRSPDGSTRELKGEEAEQVMQRMQQEGGGSRIEVNEVNGKKTYTVTGPNGKSRTLTQKEFDKLRKKMESGGGGGMMVRSSDANSPPPAHFAQSNSKTMRAAMSEQKREKKSERKKVQFSRFAVTDQTSKPDGLVRGTKVKVHYRIEGEKKIATRVELLTE